MKQTLEIYGASFNLAFTVQPGEQETLSRKVNEMYNFGIVCEPSEDYDPATDTHVILTTNLPRLRKAFKAKAETALASDAEFCQAIKGMPGYVFLNAAGELAPKLATEFLRSFERTPSYYRANRTETLAPLAIGEIQEFGWTQTGTAE
jgi:hypothetical protein